MGEYKKITKDDIDFPRYCYFFIKEIQESIDENDITNEGDEIKIEIETTDYPYCYEAFELVVKAFERKGFDVKIPTFHLTNENNVKTYTYKWKLKKIKPLDDLPF